MFEIVCSRFFLILFQIGLIRLYIYYIYFFDFIFFLIFKHLSDFAFLFHARSSSGSLANGWSRFAWCVTDREGNYARWPQCSLLYQGGHFWSVWAIGSCIVERPRVLERPSACEFASSLSTSSTSSHRNAWWVKLLDSSWLLLLAVQTLHFMHLFLSFFDIFWLPILLERKTQTTYPRDQTGLKRYACLNMIEWSCALRWVTHS